MSTPHSPLSTDLHALLRVSEALRTDVRRRTNTMITIVAVMAVFMLAVLVVVYQNAQIARRIDDCTRYGGGCYQEQQGRAGSAVARLITAQLYIAECARVTTTDADLEACVTRRLAHVGN